MNKIKVVLLAVTMVFVFIDYASAQTKAANPSPEKPKHHTKDGYQNHPFVETASPKGVLFYIRRVWGSVFTPEIPEGHALPPEESIKLLNTIKGDRISWLGHATFLLNLSGKTILTDPFLSEFASPISWAGPRRYVHPGVSLKSLPKIDILVISHSHYDHLDKETIAELNNKEKINVFVPLGLKSFFTDLGYKNVTELDWHQSVNLDGITITSIPSIHDSARTTTDQNKTLWSSWGIKSAGRNILFIGDTGYVKELFQNIGEIYGPFDYSIVPIGAYEPRNLMWMSHATPEEAISIGVDTRSETLVASHWGTISSLSDEPPFEPSTRFMAAGASNGFSDDTLWVMRVGETRAFKQK